MMILRIILVVFVFSSCSHPKGDKTPLIAKDMSSEAERNNRLIAFVGRKISITPIPYSLGDFDSGVQARYKIIQRVYGLYDKDEIEFNAYDHYGRFAFTDFENVLLFVTEQDGEYYQEKYMYNDVYMTEEGRWAGSYSEYDYGHEYNTDTGIKTVKIDFVGDVYYPTKINMQDSTINLTYQEPYYKTVGDSAILVYGNYVEDLFKLKRGGYLTARGLFDRRN